MYVCICQCMHVCIDECVGEERVVNGKLLISIFGCVCAVCCVCFLLTKLDNNSSLRQCECAMENIRMCMCMCLACFAHN